MAPCSLAFHLIRTVPYNFVLKNTNLILAATIEQISNWVSHSLHQKEKLCTDFNKIDIKEENTIELIRNKQRAEGKVTRAGVQRSSSWWRRPVGDGGGGGVRVPLVAGDPHGLRRLPRPRLTPLQPVPLGGLVEAATALDDESRPAAVQRSRSRDGVVP